ncbi:translation initiation factor IF-2 N-terminal domain-containing protein [Williamsia maris]|uniref:Ribonuclease E n=1 Tax=Williamsia maris TaxID=72806 RepID=A0ABT1HL25_9NOCA|nr:translation initiation factor IF-2 N-terminal domain-containing protein [Williamsia maris]MCP2178636.1 ribonuclease E [Williamsia maris]
MADNGSSEDLNSTDSNADSPAQEFPHKLRVHALARILGIPSREVLVHLADLGIVARSPQSSIDRSAAVQVRDRIAEPAGADSETTPTTPDAPAPVETPAASAPVESAHVESAQRDLSSESTTPSLFSAVEAVEPTTKADAGESSQGPLFLQPQTPEPGTRRRAQRAEKPAPTADDATPSGEGATATRSESPAPTVDDSNDSGGDNDNDSGGDNDGDGSGTGSRRRRRGRRGRGRGRGDQIAGEQNSDVDDSSDEDSTGSSDDSGADSTATGADESASDDAQQSDATTTEPRSGRRGGGRRGSGAKNADATTGNADDNAGEKSDDQKSGQNTSAGDKSDGKSSDGDDASTKDAGSDDADSRDDDSDDSGDDDSSANNRRRRRRRRRKGGADGDDQPSDDPPNTVVHEREPRAKSRSSSSSSSRDRDEVQGISGSTRLEAKRQRRRDGRDAGRRRPPILTESEFLARREAVDRVMVVRERSANVGLSDDSDQTTAPTEDYTQVAVLEDGVLVEHFVTTSTSSSMVGNIFLGRVQNVLPGMEAAFVDIGRGRNGVLYAGEVNWDAAGLDGGSRKIEQALRPGDPVVVQVSKDPVGHKGARLTTQISLAGRYLVYVPGGSSTGISRKLPDVERKRLKQILSKLVPAEAGVIIRTASEGVSAEELSADIDRLKAQWAQIEEATAGAGKAKGASPQALYEEPDLLVKVVRDLFNEDFKKLVVDGDSAWDHVQGYVESVAPDLADRLVKFTKSHADSPDAFVVHRIDEQLAKALERKVWLPSGGTLIIEHTEAMTVVDVNTGKFTGSGGNLEETVTRNNLEAAEEIVRQMRLRDIGGMIIVDFIDMVLESNRDLVLRRLTEALSRDRTRHQVSEVTSLGLVQMTRKRLGTGLLEAFSSTCTCCSGRGIIVHANPVEVTGGGDDAPRQESSKRSRRGGKKKADAPAEAKPAHNPSEHPMFRAMASHPEGEEPSGENTEDSASTDTAPRSEGDPTAPDRDSDPVEVATEAVAAVVDTPDASAEVVAEPAAPVAEPVVVTPPVETPPVETAVDEPEPPRKRRRAARRPAAAPVAAAEPVSGTVESLSVAAVVPADTAPVTTVGAAAAVDEPVVAAKRRPRRRAAGRPAGPPQED